MCPTGCLIHPYFPTYLPRWGEVTNQGDRTGGILDRCSSRKRDRVRLVLTLWHVAALRRI